MKIGFYGYGAFNCGLSIYLQRKTNAEIIAWDINEEVMKNLKENKKHPYHFTNTELKTKPGTIKEVFENSDYIIMGINAQFYRENAKKFKPYIKNQILIIVSKGLEIGTHKRISQIIKEETGNCKLAILSGGTTAKDIVKGDMLSATAASNDKEVLKKVTELMKSNKLTIHPTTDITGAEIAGALKNIVSIGVGICKGLGYGIGTKATLITQAAKEIKKIAKEQGAKEETFETACFWGDMILSCFGETRNKEFGERIIRKNAKEIIEEMKKENKSVEGYYTTKAAKELANEKAPVIEQIYKILYENEKPESLIEIL